MWRPDFDRLVEPTRWPQLTLRQYIVLAIIAIGLLSVVRMAHGQAPRPQWTAAACQYFAQFARGAADVRDTGADMRKHIRVLRRNAGESLRDVLPIFEREVARIYAEGRTPAEAEQAAYLRCVSGEIFGQDS